MNWSWNKGISIHLEPSTFVYETISHLRKLKNKQWLRLGSLSVGGLASFWDNYPDSKDHQIDID